VSGITLDAHECNHAAGVGDSEVRMWDDNNRRRQLGADKRTDYLEKAKHTSNNVRQRTLSDDLSSVVVIRSRHHTLVTDREAWNVWERLRGGGRRQSGAVGRLWLSGADGTAKYGQDQDSACHFCAFRTERTRRSERTRRFWASAVREKMVRNADVGMGKPVLTSLSLG